MLTLFILGEHNNLAKTKEMWKLYDISTLILSGITGFAISFSVFWFMSVSSPSTVGITVGTL
jgi:hypothetical protein